MDDDIRVQPGQVLSQDLLRPGTGNFRQVDETVYETAGFDDGTGIGPSQEDNLTVRKRFLKETRHREGQHDIADAVSSADDDPFQCRKDKNSGDLLPEDLLPACLPYQKANLEFFVSVC